MVKGMTNTLLKRFGFAVFTTMATLLGGCVTTPAAPSQVLRITPQASSSSEMRDPASIRPAAIDSVPLPNYKPPITIRAFEPHPEWIPMIKPRAWKYIVIHHSATPDGSAARFDLDHRAKGWDELGYHFVIDNGQGGPDGRVEIGSRWFKQKHGAHAKTPDSRYNDFGIGICLVGNFENTRPTPAQYRQLSELVAWLQDRYSISSDNVIGHNDTKPTACPGKNLSVAVIRNMANQVLASQRHPAIATATH